MQERLLIVSADGVVVSDNGFLTLFSSSCFAFAVIFMTIVAFLSPKIVAAIIGLAVALGMGIPIAVCMRLPRSSVLSADGKLRQHFLFKSPVLRDAGVPLFVFFSRHTKSRKELLTTSN
jgi:hypothetical protein